MMDWKSGFLMGLMCMVGKICRTTGFVIIGVLSHFVSRMKAAIHRFCMVLPMSIKFNPHWRAWWTMERSLWYSTSLICFHCDNSSVNKPWIFEWSITFRTCLSWPMIHIAEKRCTDWSKKPNFTTTFFYSTTPTPTTTSPSTPIIVSSQQTII